MEEENKISEVSDSDREIEITRDDGIVDHLKILFTYHNDERNKEYYFLFADGDEDSILCLSTTDGVSFEYLDEEETDEAEQVLEAYNDDPMIQDLKAEA